VQQSSSLRRFSYLLAFVVYSLQSSGIVSDTKISSVCFTSHQLGCEMNDASAGVSVEYGVLVRNAIKTYGVGSRKSIILENLNMTVKKGSM
jgi:hypothetical protein